MAVIALTKEEEGWFISRRGLRTLLTRAAEFAPEPADHDALEQAITFSGLLLYLLEPDQASRVAESIRRAANEWSDELQASAPDHGASWLVAALDDLEKRLTGWPPREEPSARGSSH